MRRPQLHLSTLLLVMTLFAVLLAWRHDRTGRARQMKQLRRSYYAERAKVLEIELLRVGELHEYHQANFPPPVPRGPIGGGAVALEEHPSIAKYQARLKQLRAERDECLRLAAQRPLEE